MKKNKTYNLTIESINSEGQGIAHVEGFPIYVENALPQEKVVVQITKILKHFAYGRVTEFLTQSDKRVPIVDKVGTWVASMPLQHMSYDFQLEFKKQIVIESLEKHVAMERIHVEETLGMINPWAYRNKAQIPVRNINGTLETGLYKRGTHTLIPIDNYHIQHKRIDEAIGVIRDIVRQNHIEAYDEETHTGLLRHIIVRHGYNTDELMVVLVTNEKELPHKDLIVSAIRSKLDHVVSIVQNVNDKQTNAILGRTTNVLYGDDVYTDNVLGKTYKISSQSFFQVNVLQTEVLYQKAIEYAELDKTQTVIDAYCGIGSITLNLCDKAKHVYGVEIVEDAIKMAKENAHMNGIDNVTFEVGKAEDQMRQWVSEGLHVDVIVVDPPRKGLDHTFIEASLEIKPKRIVYVSCNPVTLGRDLKFYVDAGYHIDKVQPVDMFPQTTHVETVVLLSQINK